jgi:hypothetical protein
MDQLAETWPRSYPLRVSLEPFANKPVKYKRASTTRTLAGSGQTVLTGLAPIVIHIHGLLDAGLKVILKMLSASPNRMTERFPRGNNNIENRSSYYVGDRGWSKERERRQREITETIDEDNFAEPRREHAEETLDALGALIEETEDAVRSDPETRAGMTWVEQSKFVQGLLYTWFRATRNRIERARLR